MIIKKIRQLLFDSGYRFLVLASKGYLKGMSDKNYTKKMFKVKMGKELNIDNPTTFNEKIQWIKLNIHDKQFTNLVDKFEAKKEIDKMFGGGYTIPTLGCYDKFDDIDFNSLPNSFVIKCTHDSGGLYICRDKSTFDIDLARKKINRSLKNKFYEQFREWAYKDVKPRIIIEEYMEDGRGDSLTDYKFFCFNGIPKMLYVSVGLEDHSTAKISFFDLDGHLLPFHRKDYKPFTEKLILPESFDEMTEVAQKIAKNIRTPFVRIDLYDIKGKIYFSEATFYPNAGMLPFTPEEWDEKLGSMLDLSQWG